MKTFTLHNLVDLAELGDRLGVFRDRAQAGEILTEMLKGRANSDALVMAIPQSEFSGFKFCV